MMLTANRPAQDFHIGIEAEKAPAAMSAGAVGRDKEPTFLDDAF